MLLENAGLVGDNERAMALPKSTRLVVPLAAFVICTLAMAAVGLLPGIPGLITIGG